MDFHNAYLIAIGALFVLVSLIMLGSLIRHHGPGRRPGFGGPTGRVQWLWALVPMLILGAVDLALLDSASAAGGPEARSVSTPAVKSMAVAAVRP